MGKQKGNNSDSKRDTSNKYAWEFAKEIAEKAELDYERQLKIFIGLYKCLSTWECRFNYEWQYKLKSAEKKELPQAVLQCTSAVSLKELATYADETLFGKIDKIYDVDIFYMLINTIDRWSKALLKEWKITHAYLIGNIGKTIYINGHPYRIRGYAQDGTPLLSRLLIDMDKYCNKKKGTE